MLWYKCAPTTQVKTSTCVLPQLQQLMVTIGLTSVLTASLLYFIVLIPYKITPQIMYCFVLKMEERAQT